MAPPDQSLMHPAKRVMTAPGMPGLGMMPQARPQIMGMGNALSAIPVLQPAPGGMPSILHPGPPTNQFAQFPPPNPNAQPPAPVVPPQGLIPLGAPPVNQIPAYPPMAPPPLQQNPADAPPGFYPEERPGPQYGEMSSTRDDEKKKKKKKRKKKRKDEIDDGSPPPVPINQGYHMVNGVPQMMMMPVMLPSQGVKPKKKKITKTKPRATDPMHLRYCAGDTWVDKSLTEWPDNDFRIFCGDLGNEVSDAMLTSAFSKYPSFAKAKVIRDKRNGKSRGYGFISFLDPQDFLRALKEMQGKYVGNRPIKLKKSKWKDRIKHVKSFKPGLRPNPNTKRYTLPGPV